MFKIKIHTKMRYFTYILSSFSFMFFLSCTPKNAEKIKEEVTEETVEIVEETERATPCTTFDDISNRDEIETAFVLYRDQMKLKNIEKAYPIWQKAMHGA